MEPASNTRVGRIVRSTHVSIQGAPKNKHQIEGNWKQLKGRAKEKWGELTDDDLDYIEGRRERLVGRIQERYGKAEAEASDEVDKFFDELDRAVTR